MASTVWRGRLAFGLVSIPVRLYKASRRERIRFHHVYKPAAPEPAEEAADVADEPEPPSARGQVREFPVRGAALEPAPPPPPLVRVRNLPASDFSEAPVEKSEVLKGYEIEKDRYVTFEPGEVAALRPKTSTELAIGEFVKLEEIDPIYFETSYYATPDREGEKPYALLFRALTETGYAAVGSLAMHGRGHATVIRPGKHGLIVHTLFYQNEVRAAEEHRTDSTGVNPKELQLAKTFVTALAAPFDPAKLKDTFEERLRELIHARAEEAIDAYPGREDMPARAPVVDIMEALRKSIELAKKPPARESAPAATRGRKRRAK